MTLATWIVGLSCLSQTPATASDVITLKDGKVVLGQVVETDRQGSMMVLVRRDWAKANLPEKLEAWEKVEAPIIKRSSALRRDRLAAWRQDRPATAPQGDRITPWIDAQLADTRDTPSTLMTVKLAKAEVKSAVKRPAVSRRMLRLGWLSKLNDVESMPLADLAQALEGKGFVANREEAVPVDSLLPVPSESDNRWLLRRGATEVAADQGGRFIRYQGMVLDDAAPGEGPGAKVALDAVGAMLNGGSPDDLLNGKLRDLAAKGRVGAMITRMEMADDLTKVTVEAALWIKLGNGKWMPALARSSTAGPNDAPADAGADLAADPQVQGAFGIVEGLGFGAIPAEIKQKSLNIGAATSRAIAQARNGLAVEMQAVLLPITAAPRPEPKAKAKE